MKLTVILYWKKRAIPLAEYIKSLKFADEIFLIGNALEEIPREVSQSNNIIIFPLSNRDYDIQFKNFLLNKAKGKWVLFVNSNEIIGKSLAKEIIKGLHTSKFAGYFVKIVDESKNKLIHTKEIMNIYQMRLGRKNAGIWESEGKGVETWELIGNMGILKKPLTHIVDPTLEELIAEMNEFTSFRARELFNEKRKENLISLFFFPAAKFFIDYILKKGFLHGTNGFVFAAIMSFRTFLTRVKLWMLWKNENN